MNYGPQSKETVAVFSRLMFPGIRDLIFSFYIGGHPKLSPTTRRIVEELNAERNRINDVIAILEPLLEKNEEQEDAQNHE